MMMGLSVLAPLTTWVLLGESGAEAVPHLIEALHDVYEPVRLNAAYTLGAVGEPAVPHR